MLLIIQIDVFINAFYLDIMLLIGLSTNDGIIDIYLLLGKKHIVIVKLEHFLKTLDAQ